MSGNEALRAALEHWDERIDPERSTGEMTAREWRDAYFTLARIATKQLEAAWAAAAAPGIEVLAKVLALHVLAQSANAVLLPSFGHLCSEKCAPDLARMLAERQGAKDYSRSRHSHPDDVSCAAAGDAGHKPWLSQQEDSTNA